MSSSVYFDYNTFFKYYSDPSNFLQNNIQIKINFFKGLFNALDNDFLPIAYFNFNNIDIYVTIKENDIFFTLPKYDNNILWADHFHIGFKLKDDVRRRNKNVDMVFFHLSIQNIEAGRKDMYHKCNFRDRLEDINDIANILCTNRRHDNMKSVFEGLLPIVIHILRKPFDVNLQLNGGLFHNYKKTTRKHTDKNGYEYTVYKKGEKYYIKKKLKTTGKFTYRGI